MVTLKEIAKAVGVSTATVSRVLNFDATLSVTAKKRQAIIEAAEALNYATPRNRNRANQQGLNKVALVHFLRPDQELSDPYYVALRLGIESRCAALKIETVKVYHTDSMPDPSLLQSASGVIAIGSLEDAEVAWLKRHARQLVFADFAPADDEIDSVQSDLALAMRKLLAALVEMGYRRIAYLGWNDVRAMTYMNWMRDARLYDEHLARGDNNTEEGGYRAAKTLLSEGLKVDALVLFNDSMAVGAYRAIHELGLRIPEDIAVASFNDISVAQFMNPPLSTVHLPAEEIGETAVELLLERAGGRELAKRITLASHLIWRGSTRHPVSA
ncbi:MAG: LacI family DNA-binding transcriptional regulator [Devosia sp.]